MFTLKIATYAVKGFAPSANLVYSTVVVYTSIVVLWHVIKRVLIFTS